MLSFIKDEITSRIKERGDRFSGKYAKLGFWSNPFLGSEHPMKANFDSLFYGRKDLVRNLSDLLVEGLVGMGQDVAIVAPSGSGGRSVANLFGHFLSTIDEDDPSLELAMLREKIASVIGTPIEAFTPELRDEAKKSIMASLKSGKLTIITSNFGDRNMPLLSSKNHYNESTIETFRKVLEFDSMSSDKVIYISPWTASAWQFLTTESPTLTQVYEHIILLPSLSQRDIVQLLKRRMAFYRLEGSTAHPLSDDVLGTVASYAGNLPRFALEFSAVLLEHCLSSRMGKARAESVLKQHSPSFQDLVSSLTKLIPPPKPWQKKENTLKRIILAMIHLGGNEVTATEISRVVDKSRPAISRNLQLLAKHRLVRKVQTPQRDERRVPFSLDEFAKAVFEQEILMKEIKDGQG